MSEKSNNFKTAVNELLSGKVKTTDESAATQAQAQTEPLVTETKVISSTVPSPSFSAPEEPKAVDYASLEATPPVNVTSEKVRTSIYPESESVLAPSFSAPEKTQPSNMLSIFAPDLVVEGNVKSKSDVNLNGYIKGNVTCEGSINSTGTIDGNIDGTDVVLTGSTVNGNINVKGSIIIDNNSSVTGDITGHTLISDGTINGNISLDDSISLQSNASVVGNIKARNISVEGGTSLSGSIEIKTAQATSFESAPRPTQPEAPAAPEAPRYSSPIFPTTE